MINQYMDGSCATRIHRSLCRNGVLRNFSVRPTEAHSEAAKLLGVVEPVGVTRGGVGVCEVGAHMCVFF